MYHYGYISEARVSKKGIEVLFGIPHASGKWFSRVESNETAVGHIMRVLGIPGLNGHGNDAEFKAWLINKHCAAHPIFVISTSGKSKRAWYGRAKNEGELRIPELPAYDRSMIFWDGANQKNEQVKKDYEEFLKQKEVKV
jgi:hypothetical protein